MQGWTTKPAWTWATWWAASVFSMRWNPLFKRDFCDICEETDQVGDWSVAPFINGHCSFTWSRGGRCSKTTDEHVTLTRNFACLSCVFIQTSAGSSQKTSGLIWKTSRRVQKWRFPAHDLYCFGVGNRRRGTMRWMCLTCQVHGGMVWRSVRLFTVTDRI